LLNNREKFQIQLFSASAFADFENWQPVGTFEYDEASMPRIAQVRWIIPYKKDKFLFILNWIQTWPENMHGLKFIEVSLRNNKFVLGSNIYIDYADQPLPLRSTTDRPNAVMDAFMTYAPIIFDDYVLLVSKNRGVFWILDTETGTIRQKKLYNDLTDEHTKRQDILTPIIANVCPAPDGSLIIAARPKKNAFKMEWTSPTDLPPQERLIVREKWISDNLLKYPEIEWWKLDLKEGTFTTMPPPQGDMPTLVDDPDKWHKFIFRVHPDERVTLAR
jgi:hypothetical protein